ncbi:MAG TPA: DNA recombination protein RmuC [Myxococcales bacterium]|nr:DNA recombination protein RmuC [Myxococcales bacterium]
MTAVAFAAALLSTGIAFWAGWLLARRGREAREAELQVRIEEREARLSEAGSDLSRAADREKELQNALRAESARASALEASLQAERRATEEKAKTYEEMSSRAQEAFKSLSVDALRANMDEFVRVAQLSMEKFQEAARGDLDERRKAVAELVDPVREKLERFEGSIQQIEKERGTAYAGLSVQVRALLEQTGKLTNALRSPAVRGRWGEIHLRRAVELSGLAEHCDFAEQVTARSDDGMLRPDLVVRLPAGRTVLVDAKAPMNAYLDAAEAVDESARAAHLRTHASQVRQHVAQLARKTYWEAFEDSVELIVLFLPNDALFSAALEQDRDLLDHALAQKVVLATPSTLGALLLTIAHGWKQEKLAINARDIANLGRDLHKRIADFARHLGKLGKHLEGTVRSYNDAIGSLELRVLPSARRFEDLQAANVDVEIDVLESLEGNPRQLHAPELIGSEVPEDAN